MRREIGQRRKKGGEIIAQNLPKIMKENRLQTQAQKMSVIIIFLSTHTDTNQNKVNSQTAENQIKQVNSKHSQRRVKITYKNKDKN